MTKDNRKRIHVYLTPESRRPPGFSKVSALIITPEEALLHFRPLIPAGLSPLGGSTFLSISAPSLIQVGPSGSNITQRLYPGPGSPQVTAFSCNQLLAAVT